MGGPLQAPGQVRTSGHPVTSQPTRSREPLPPASALNVSTWDPGAGQPGDVVTATASATALLTAGTEQGSRCGHACDCDRCQTMTAVLSVRASAWVDAPRQDCPGTRSEHQQDGALQLPFLSLALALGSRTYRDPVHARSTR